MPDFVALVSRERRDWFQAATAPEDVAALRHSLSAEDAKALGKQRYGEHADRIASLEAALNADFDDHMGVAKPVIWPVSI